MYHQERFGSPSDPQFSLRADKSMQRVFRAAQSGQWQIGEAELVVEKRHIRSLSYELRVHIR